VLLFEFFCLACLGFQIRVDLRLVGVVVGKGGMNLRQRQVTKLPHNLFRYQVHVVPLSDPANGDTCPGDARPPATNVGAPGDRPSVGYPFGERNLPLTTSTKTDTVAYEDRS